MPEISRFLGIVVAIFYKDHRPPHFHAKYGSFAIVVQINDGVVEGRFPARALALVIEWYNLHKSELLEDWQLAEQLKPLNPIEPLE